MSKIKRFFLITFLLSALVGSGFLLWLSHQYVVPIIMYHHVVDGADANNLNVVSTDLFEQHMAYLKKHHFNVLSLDELVEGIQRGKEFSRKTVVITFDDANVDNYGEAFKILKQYKFPAIIFTPSDLVGTEGHLSWVQLKEMVAAGLDVGSHTRRHAYLPDLSERQQRDEIIESKRILEEQLGVDVDYFSYPIGGFSLPIQEIVREAGYKGACATNRGFDRKNKSVWELNRIRLSRKDTEDMVLWVKLSGYYNVFRKAKNPY